MLIATWITVLLLSISSSIDNFGVGISYGIRKIKVGFVANGIISAIAFVFSMVGIYSGRFLADLFPGTTAEIIATAFLFVIGIRIIMLTFPPKKEKQQTDESVTGVITGYLHSPEKADLDQSGEIGFYEAIVLGIAISMNALTNGLGAGLMNVSPLALSLISALFSFGSIWLGVALGSKIANITIGKWSIGQFSTALSGVILLGIALHNLL
ncbi:sporulation protein YtaF [Fictibacillus macauensis ZFHKF-1]|uniref:Sporulation protein YtaF n=1 Tax=Fictibacillus macauensis ZFHKF-1 TaxID=1196324 RepID=I8J5B2_9BACL|nr:sporulation membrane protein YtaF [Fictibacillus macauensis]EIT86961.1 sporulation protein YtaF [Fictibacillus macauensis ZFHKF-1]